jgi:lipid-A-disaccharide synthase
MTEPAVNILMTAGETSGDLHAAALASGLLRLQPDLQLWGMGGPAMHSAGVAIEQPMDAVEVMGLVEVLSVLGNIRSALLTLTALAAERRPAAAILTDFADFNLRLAARLKELGIPIIYFISPKVWAWRKGRARTIQRLVDLMLLIFPFEEAFYRSFGMSNVRYVGNPLVDELQSVLQKEKTIVQQELGLSRDEPVIGVLPGSRMNEIRKNGRLFVEGALLAARDTGATVVAAPPEGDKAEAFKDAVQGLQVAVVPGKAREVLRVSKAAVVKSGTGTLEAAILRTPAVVGYRANWFSFHVVKALVGVKYMSLPNLILDRPVFPELVQSFTAEDIAAALKKMWEGPERECMLSALDEVRERLGPPGAARRAAEAVLDFLKQRPDRTADGNSRKAE